MSFQSRLYQLNCSMPSGTFRKRWQSQHGNNQVFQQMPNLETEWVFVARPTASIRIEKKTFLVFVGDVVVQVLCDRKLSMKLDSQVIVRQLPLSYQD
jgi:hypothetical protein